MCGLTNIKRWSSDRHFKLGKGAFSLKLLFCQFLPNNYLLQNLFFSDKQLNNALADITVMEKMTYLDLFFLYSKYLTITLDYLRNLIYNILSVWFYNYRIAPRTR